LLAGLGVGGWGLGFSFGFGGFVQTGAAFVLHFE
jgi:hypothetical protein